MADIIYLNGHLVPRSEAKLSPFDRGFLYGYGLFETMRAYNGHIFRLDRHLARLRHSAEILGLSPDVIASRSNGTASPPSVLASEAKQSLETACRKTLTANGLKDARVRLTVSAGEGDMVPDPATSPRPTVLVTAESLTPLSAESYTQGFRAVLSSLRRNSQSPLSGLKSTCYLNNVLARIEARAAGCDEAIMLNERGYLAEGSSTNIFLVGKSPSLGGRGQVRVLITPSLKSGILPGITREAVLEIAQALNLEVQERDVELKELTGAEEAFVTNSILEIMPLTWFEGKFIGTGRPGRLTRKLMAAYSKLIESNNRQNGLGV